MGQQQLLLIVLALIAVGVAIAVGFQIYDETHRESAIDFMTKDLSNIAGLAISYYRTPVELGGGSQSFTGGSSQFKIPSQLDTLNDRTYAINSISDNSIELVGKSLDLRTGTDGTRGVIVYVQLDSKGITNFRIEN